MPGQCQLAHPHQGDDALILNSVVYTVRKYQHFSLRDSHVLPYLLRDMMSVMSEVLETIAFIILLVNADC